MTSFSVNSIFLEHTMKPLVLALVDHRSTAWPWMATIKRLQLHVLFSPIEQKERKVTYKGVFGEYSYSVILLKKLQMEECLPYMGNIYFPHFVIIIIATATSSSPSTSPICHHHHCCCHQKKWYSLIVWCSLCTLVYGLLFFQSVTVLVGLNQCDWSMKYGDIVVIVISFSAVVLIARSIFKCDSRELDLE